MSDSSLQFHDLFGRDISVVSTIDHPYPSPPIHLFDGHLRLRRKYGDGVLVLNWDVSHPLDRFYRYDLITDTGLIAKQPALYHYQLDKSYSEQQFDPTPFLLLPQCIELAISALQVRRKLSDQFAFELVTRALDIVKQAESIYSIGIKPWSYTAALLKAYYRRLDQPELYALIEHQYSNYWLSTFTND